jgi:hypothetical protein
MQLGTQPVAPTGGQPTPTEPAYDPSAVLPQQQCPLIYQRMTINTVPDTSNLLNKSAIPFGCVIHPMAEATNPEVIFPTNSH